MSNAITAAYRSMHPLVESRFIAIEAVELSQAGIGLAFALPALSALPLVLDLLPLSDRRNFCGSTVQLVTHPSEITHYRPQWYSECF